MERILTYQISEEITIKGFLKQKLHFSPKQISGLKFRENGIRVNGTKRRVDYLLKPGEELVLLIEVEENHSGHLRVKEGKVNILYEDADLLAVDKPAGILVHPVGGHYEDTLSNLVVSYFQEKGQKAVIRPVGRLDKDTSGAVVFAKNQMAAAKLSHKNGFWKEYLALVEGHPGTTKGEINKPIGRCSEKRLKMQIDVENGKEAFTFYEVVERFADSSLIKLTIATGRTHQIRVHMAHIGCPLLGDPLYGKPCLEFKRAALHAWKLHITKPFTGDELLVEAPLPMDFNNYLKRKEDENETDNTLLHRE